MIKKLYKKRIIVAWIILFTMIISTVFSTPVEAKTKAPSINCKMSDSNLMKLMKVYDKDAYYILKSQKAKGDSFTSWMLHGNNITEVVDTSVHEEFHCHVWSYAGGDGSGFNRAFYIGDKKTIYVPETKVFKTYKATKHIPKKYRTFRYDTYVDKTSDVSANTSGVYGLLNEFSAYYWGMHANNSLYPYISKYADSGMDWRYYINSNNTNKNAYAEFYYYTLVYLEYARKNEPEIYEGIINNKNYMKTLYKMESKYRKLIKSSDKNINKVVKKYGGRVEKNGINVTYWFGNSGFTVKDEYGLLMKQIKSKKYKAVRNEIKKRGK
ncbi:hypothetical protein SAMN06297422_1024 [Lachnospiraceae bacterium]|nr:hypothetical protein SAMN06297422_1024 [Lachnospiraceae bacterium]